MAPSFDTSGTEVVTVQLTVGEAQAILMGWQIEEGSRYHMEHEPDYESARDKIKSAIKSTGAEVIVE